MHRLYVLGIAFGKIIDISNVNNLVSREKIDCYHMQGLRLTSVINLVVLDLLDTADIQRV